MGRVNWWVFSHESWGESDPGCGHTWIGELPAGRAWWNGFTCPSCGECSTVGRFVTSAPQFATVPEAVAWMAERSASLLCVARHASDQLANEARGLAADFSSRQPLVAATHRERREP